MLREVAYEGNDPKQIMESYHLLGIVLQKDKQYTKAVICYK
jgi:hypothetical protein